MKPLQLLLRHHQYMSLTILDLHLSLLENSSYFHNSLPFRSKTHLQSLQFALGEKDQMSILKQIMLPLRFIATHRLFQMHGL
ncbi:hypothetical protein Scep_023482 [Stephania cephalantha]|uniref:Uncharacterized protein n=1 Tax=Stephania cephalantha TaxID=152367 RepID=A0AAP0F064_9MAGN